MVPIPITNRAMPGCVRKDGDAVVRLERRYPDKTMAMPPATN